MCELNDSMELNALANNIKKVYYQDYKSAYNDDGKEIDKSQFNYII